MRNEGIARSCIRRRLIGLSWLVTIAAPAAAYVPPPVITLQGSDSYTVTYTPCEDCAGHGLVEYQEATGSSDYVGSGTQTFDHRPPGTYHYRVVYMISVYGGYYPEYSDVATVSLTATSEPGGEGPTLAAELEAEYVSTRGDINGDGRQDLLLRPANQSAVKLYTTEGYVLLRQNSNGTFSASVPGMAELGAAANWQWTNIEIGARDVNIDGRADLVLRDVRDEPGLGLASNQIVFGPITQQPGAVLATRAADAGLAAFSRDINRHLVDPEYYPNNAPLNYAVVAYTSPYCYEFALNWWGEPIYLPCIEYVSYYYVVYRDYSAYHWDAIRIASDDYAMIHGSDWPANAMQRIDQTLERVLGVAVGGWDINELLGAGGAVSDEAVRRGMELFAVLAGIGEAAAQEPGTGAGQSDADRVLLKGRRVLGQGPFHTALEYRGSTVSAHDSDRRMLFDGTLVSQLNWPNDHPTLTLRLGYVDGPTPPVTYWASLVAADSRYDDDLPYDLFPSIGAGGYNSNSFVSGLIQATAGMPTVPMTRYVGGERPVPAGEFF